LVYIHHWNKSEKKNYLDRSSGSTAITAAVRHVLSVIPDTKTTRKIVVSKSNIDDQLPELTVIKAGKDILIREINQSVETQKDKSEEFLTKLFSHKHEIPAADVYHKGGLNGLSVDILKKAKGRLGIKSAKNQEGWIWTWPFT
jgi:RecA-family ATPase